MKARGSPWGAYVLRADRGVERFGGTSASEYPVIRHIRTNWRTAAKPSSLPVSESTLRVTRVGAFTLNEAHTLVPTRTATNLSSASISDMAGLHSVRSRDSQDGETPLRSCLHCRG